MSFGAKRWTFARDNATIGSHRFRSRHPYLEIEVRIRRREVMIKYRTRRRDALPTQLLKKLGHGRAEMLWAFLARDVKTNHGRGLRRYVDEFR